MNADEKPKPVRWVRKKTAATLADMALRTFDRYRVKFWTYRPGRSGPKLYGVDHLGRLVAAPLRRARRRPTPNRRKRPATRRRRG